MRARRAVVIVTNRVDARAVPVSGVGNALECPLVAGPDREAGRAITLDLTPRDVLQHGLGKADVGEEFPIPLIGGAAVLVPVTRKFVSVVDDAADHLGVALGDPAQREERRVHVGIRQ